MTTATVQHLLDAKGHHLWSVTPDGCADGELMPWRLQQLGLDPGYVKVCCTSIYEDMQSVCASCKSRRLCARDLARGDVESGMRCYCPNEPTIDALIINWVP